MLLPVCAVLVLSLTGAHRRSAKTWPHRLRQPRRRCRRRAAEASAEGQNQPSPAEQARIRQVIAQVEAAYAAGDADYRKGMLADAKTQQYVLVPVNHKD